MSTAVGWDDEPAVREWRDLPALPGDRTADACVVGLGSSGLAAVEALADRGLTVVGLDAGRVASGAAGRNGGFLLGGPAPFLHDAIARWGSDAVDLYRATLAELDRLVESLGSTLISRAGSIRLAGLPGEPDAAESADVSLHAAALRAHDIPVEDYDGPLGVGIYLPDDAVTNPALRALAQATRLAARAELYEQSRVEKIESGNVVTAFGIVHAPIIIVAVDGGLDRVVPQLSGRVRTARLQMLTTAPIEPRLSCPVYARWGYDYAQQLPGGRLFVGGGRDRFVEEEWTHSAEPSAPVQAYIKTVAERFAGRPIDVTNRWAASVGYTTDGRPLCAIVDDGVVAIGGYSGTGNLVGPVTARAAVKLACDGTAVPSYLAS